ncbi:cupin domain-containing protein [Kangiella geojedonensis]|uniref:Cupin 4 family protein n=1 Tax=Kangiella geojedonensis TaxID=914150 RepID=A0A0F6RC88_9GAMM|nr:cupin domain-containing protein [Kangiella geojedonensis]AKE52218.1 Cupin 4 family protein [Kangiella geojedonensis]
MAKIQSSMLGDISPEEFLSDYWQKKPLLIRGGFSADPALITPEELAGYSLDDDIESRLIQHNSQQQRWQLSHGPLEETVFEELGEKNWTLLVQSLDYFHPPLQELTKACNFLPRWRLDDIMVSFATAHGGVGPHLDKYDVFLVQGQGQRRWRVGFKDQKVSTLNPHPQIAQVAPFEATMDVIVSPGDVLYIPPNTPHWGVSVDNSITYSIGFRAPNIGSILDSALSSASLEFDSLWQDSGKLKKYHAFGALHSEMPDWALGELQHLLNRRELLIAAGKTVTELKYPEALEPVNLPKSQELSEIALTEGVELNLLARIAYFEHEQALLTFINGVYFQFPKGLEQAIQTLNQKHRLTPEDLSELPRLPLGEFLTHGIALGALTLSNSDS